MSAFTDDEIQYLGTQDLGRLATVQPDGTLQNSPVGFRFNADLDTIDILGYHLADSQKFRNIRDNGRVAFVVDDVPSLQPRRVRCLEIRGTAEAITGHPTAEDWSDDALIRVHPRRIISFGIADPDTEPHLTVASKRNV